MSADGLAGPTAVPMTDHPESDPLAVAGQITAGNITFT
jgi:hypothetical protein